MELYQIIRGRRILKKLTQQQLADTVGVTKQAISQFEKGVSKPKPEILEKMSSALDFDFTTVNSNIVRPDGAITTVGNNKRKPEALIPFYNADFIAGNAEQFYDDAIIYPEYYMDVPEFSGCTAFRAYSDSMEKLIRSGSILFGVKIEDWQSHIEYGQIYGITTTDKRRYLKYIRKSAEDHKKYFLLKSENDDYDDFELPKEKIKNIWLIEGWLDKRT